MLSENGNVIWNYYIYKTYLMINFKTKLKVQTRYMFTVYSGCLLLIITVKVRISQSSLVSLFINKTMKFLQMTLLVLLLVAAIAIAFPADETVAGDLYDTHNISPQDPQEFFKLKKLKKLLLLG
ncbi:hypothetical protein ACFFRR_009668 [Megaselia abdita]